MVLSPLESAEHIVQNAKYVTINEVGIKNIAQHLVEVIVKENFGVDDYSQHELHPKLTDANAIEWIFVIDTLNFCFWTKIENHTKYTVNGFTGYFALCAAIKRAIQEGIDITNAHYYSKIDLQTLQHIFRADNSNVTIPLLTERLECLKEVGDILLEKWQGKFENVLKAANGSAKNLLKLIVREFPCFRDEAIYAGKQVSFYKRAQILISDIAACYRSQSLGNFQDLHEITMFADYRVPQVLVHFAAISYNNELIDLLKSNKILQNGDPMEVEIRGASIYAVEQIKRHVLEELKVHHSDISRDHINSTLIDYYLWDYRRKHSAELECIPFHKVLSIYY